LTVNPIPMLVNLRQLLENLRDTSEDWSRRLLAVEVDARLSPKERQLLLRNHQFANRHAGRRGFVLGTGPSVGRQNLAPLSSEITFAVNSFWRHPELLRWQPTYYLLTDGLFFSGKPEHDDFVRKAAAAAHTSQFFVPLQYREHARSLIPEERLHYLSIDGFLWHRQYKGVDLSKTIHSPSTVVQTAMLVALYMGCSPLYLLGLDHTWAAEPSGSYFHDGKNAFQAAPSNNTVSYGYLCEFIGNVWVGYESIHQLASERGAQIFNATRGGALDLFERVEYESLFEK
jgi:hypothetical protein